MKRDCESINNKIKDIKVCQLLLLFYATAVLGWTWEFLLRYELTGTIAKWGVLHGPWAPIYGFGGILTVMLARYAAGNPLKLFAGSMVLCTALEYGTSMVLEKGYGVRWWDYSTRAFNLDGRICLEVTLFFGIVCVFLVYLILPRFLGMIRTCSRSRQKWISVVITIFFITDVAISLWSPNMAGLL